MAKIASLVRPYNRILVGSVRLAHLQDALGESGESPGQGPLPLKSECPTCLITLVFFCEPWGSVDSEHVGYSRHVILSERTSSEVRFQLFGVDK